MFVGVLLLLSVAASATSASTAASAKTRWRATVAKLPANATTDLRQDVYLSSISCASPGNCSAVGSYIDNAGHQKGLLLTETAGKWAAGVEAVLPGNADFDPQVSLGPVSCASPGNCTAIGGYRTVSGYAGLLLTQTAGHWAAGVGEASPANALRFVSCASAGNCIALGTYSGGFVQLTERAGHWGSAVEAPLPSVFNGQPAQVNSFSCSPAGTCSAVGTYNIHSDRDGYTGSGMLLSNDGGTWRAVDPVMPPDGPGEGVVLTSVSCASAGNCGVGGLYNVNLDGATAPEGVLLTEKAGKWLRGVKAIPPTHAKGGYWRDYVGLDGISCASAGNCGAVGDYYDNHGHKQLTLLTQKAGRWGTAVKAALPDGGHFPSADAISCASPQSCTVVGSYAARGWVYHGLLLTEVHGGWAKGVKAPRAGYVSSVSCASPGNCGAVGRAAQGSGILLDSTTH